MTDKPSRPWCPHCGRQNCGTAEQIPGWGITCDTIYTYNPDGSYTTRHGPEHDFGGFARDREDFLIEETIEQGEEINRLKQQIVTMTIRAQKMWEALYMGGRWLHNHGYKPEAALLLDAAGEEIK